MSGTLEENGLVRRMFVGKIPAAASDDDVKEFLTEKCGGGPGAVVSVIIKQGKSTTERSNPDKFGFIEFSKSDFVEEILIQRGSLHFKGRKLEVKHYIPSRDEEIPGAHIRTEKLFVVGLPKDYDQNDVKKELKADLEKHFDKRYGTVELVEVATPKGEPGKTKGFGFITLSSQDFADRLVVGHSSIRLMGRDMRLKKSEPYEKKSGGPGGPPSHHPPVNSQVGLLPPPSSERGEYRDRGPQNDRPVPLYDDREHNYELAVYEEELRRWYADRRHRDEEEFKRRLEEFDSLYQPRAAEPPRRPLEPRGDEPPALRRPLIEPRDDFARKPPRPLLEPRDDFAREPPRPLIEPRENFAREPPRSLIEPLDDFAREPPRSQYKGRDDFDAYERPKEDRSRYPERRDGDRYAPPSRAGESYGQSSAYANNRSPSREQASGYSGGRGSPRGASRGTPRGGARGSPRGGARGSPRGGARGSPRGGARGASRGGARGSSRGGRDRGGRT